MTLAAKYSHCHEQSSKKSSNSAMLASFLPVVIHKPDRGVVHVSFTGRGEHLAELREAVENAVAADMRCERTSQSGSIAIDVPAFDDLSDPSSQSSAITEALEAASRLALLKSSVGYTFDR